MEITRRSNRAQASSTLMDQIKIDLSRLAGCSLASAIATDVKRYAPVLLLLISCLVLSGYTVAYSQQTRELVVRDNQIKLERDRLQIEQTGLLLEQRTLEEHSRISRKARDDLSMVQPEFADEKVVML